MIIYDSKDKELNIPIGLGNLNRVSPDYNGGDCKGFYEEGYDDGFEEGKTEGIEEGYETGFREGKIEGLDEGYDRGYGEGKTEGVDAYVSTLPTLTIDRNGVYDTVNKGVTVNVDIPVVDLTGVKFQGSKFSEIPQWIDFGNITDLNSMFYACKNLTHISHLNTPIAQTTASMFYDCSLVTEVELFDTSNVTTMSSMFEKCHNITTVPLFDTSNVNRMLSMFASCYNLTTVPLFNTSNVRDMGWMFYYCQNHLTTVPLFDTQNVTDMESMFRECTSLTTVPQFNTQNVTTMENMFYNCISLTSLPAFNVSKATNMGYIFGSSIINTLTDVGGWIGLKCNWNDNQGLRVIPNLTYQSCINVLNGLYDFTGNGETPDLLRQGRLKVHPNFLTTVGDEISIGVNKGWTITA